MDDSTNRNLILVIESRIDELERYPTNNEQLARIDELKSILLTIRPPPPPPAMVDFSDAEVICIIKSRIKKLKDFPIYREQVIWEVENLLEFLFNLNKEDIVLNSSLTRAAIVQIDSRIDILMKCSTYKRGVIRELNKLRQILVPLLKSQVHDYSEVDVDVDSSKKRRETICLLRAIVKLLSLASPEPHDPDFFDLLNNLTCRDPMLLLDENDLETIHQFVSNPDVSNNMRNRDAISEFCIHANWWLECNADAVAAVHRPLCVRLKNIISAINNPPNPVTLEMESEKLSANNGQQSNSRDGKQV